MLISLRGSNVENRKIYIRFYKMCQWWSIHSSISWRALGRCGLVPHEKYSESPNSLNRINRNFRTSSHWIELSKNPFRYQMDFGFFFVCVSSIQILMLLMPRWKNPSFKYLFIFCILFYLDFCLFTFTNKWMAVSTSQRAQIINKSYPCNQASTKWPNKKERRHLHSNVRSVLAKRCKNANMNGSDIIE